jgi:hypothetical protein
MVLTTSEVQQMDYFNATKPTDPAGTGGLCACTFTGDTGSTVNTKESELETREPMLEQTRLHEVYPRLLRQ